jgi:hypothetical protein
MLNTLGGGGDPGLSQVVYRWGKACASWMNHTAFCLPLNACQRTFAHGCLLSEAW